MALSPDEQWLAVANYADGTVGLIRLEADGAFGGLMDTVRPGGHGVDPERQDGPHAHCVVFEEGGQALYHVDLGLDCVFRHRIGDNGFEDTTIAYQALPGAGPRHLIFHHDGEHALLICELDAHLVLLRRDGDSLTCVDRVPACPEQTEHNLGGHLALAPTGEVWVTNRGHDSIVCFDIRDGKLRRGEWYPTGGSSPRHFVIEDGRAIVAHEESGGVVSTAFASDARSRLDVPAAAFLLDIPE